MAIAGAHLPLQLLRRLVVVIGLVLLVPPANAAERVPRTIDATGSSDVTGALRHFVDSVHDGETIVFPAGARYRIDGTLEWQGRRDLTLEGNGATLVATARGGSDRAHVRLLDGGGWTIRELAVVGANPDGGRFDPAHQWQHGFDLRGVDGAKLERVSVSDVFGDGIYVGASTTTSDWSSDILVADASVRRTGRMALAVTAGRRITVEGGTWDAPGLSTFDVEPNGRPGGADGVLIERATLGRGTRHGALYIAGSGPVSNVTFRGNVLTGRPLHVRVDQAQGRPRNIVIRGNTSTVPFGGPRPAAMVFRNTDGVTVSGNVQPLKPGTGLTLVASQGSTGVHVGGRATYREIRSDGPLWWLVVGTAAALLVMVGAGLGTRRRRSLVSRPARGADPPAGSGSGPT